MAPLPLPDIRDITWVFEELFGREVKTREAPALELGPDLGAIITLLDDSNRVRALWMFDLKLANILGTALAVGHADKANMATQTGVIPSDLKENVAEVVNVGLSGINGEGRIHVVLGPMAFLDDGSFNSDLWRSIARTHKLKRGSALSHRVSVSGYGSGLMTICSLGKISVGAEVKTHTDLDDDWSEFETHDQPSSTKAQPIQTGSNSRPIQRGPRSFIRWGTQARSVR
jgi:hypothetical protein